MTTNASNYVQYGTEKHREIDQHLLLEGTQKKTPDWKDLGDLENWFSFTQLDNWQLGFQD